MKKLFSSIALLSLALFITASAWAAPSSKARVGRNPTTSDWVEEVFVDYKAPTHAGPGPHPSEESSDYHLTQGGISWPGGADIKYEIVDGTVPDNTAVEAAIATWDGFITTRTFVRDDGSPTANPCGGDSSVVWTAMDGSGGILAATSVCRNVVTKEIAGFVVTMDSAEAWATDGLSPLKFDVENVAAHEFGHAAGLGHDNSPKSGCLTMYRYAALGEIQKRTLGLGDKLGMNALYGPVNTTPGSCGS